jgi:hypothetical protein
MCRMVLLVEGCVLPEPPATPTQLYTRCPTLLTQAHQLANKNPRRSAQRIAGQMFHRAMENKDLTLILTA